MPPNCIINNLLDILYTNHKYLYNSQSRMIGIMLRISIVCKAIDKEDIIVMISWSLIDSNPKNNLYKSYREFIGSIYNFLYMGCIFLMMSRERNLFGINERLFMIRYED